MMSKLLALLMLLPFAQTGEGPTDRAYRLSAGDVISIQVFGEADLSPEVKISERGTIPYPFLGELTLAGLTTAQAESLIHDGLEGPYLVDPRVNVTVVEYRPFYINGQVKRPGSYAWQPGLTVQKALTLAGGLTERASSRKIFIVPDKATSEDDRIRVELTETVGPGDIITVEESFF